MFIFDLDLGLVGLRVYVCTSCMNHSPNPKPSQATVIIKQLLNADTAGNDDKSTQLVVPSGGQANVAPGTSNIQLRVLKPQSLGPGHGPGHPSYHILDIVKCLKLSLDT